MIPDEEPEEHWRTVLSKPMNVHRFQSPASEVEFEVAAASDCGKVQLHNTDHYLAVRLGRLQETLVTSLPPEDLPATFEEYAYAMLVADGIGEQGAGARASRVALSALAHLAVRYGKWNVRVGPETPADIIEQGEFFYRQANEAVIQAGRADFRLANMAASVTAVYVAGTDLFFAHAGHAKAFLFRNGLLIQLTTDHTLAQCGQTASGPRPLEGARIDLKHIVTETLGGRPGGPHVEIEHVQLWSGDRILLCTNGLTDVVSEDQMADVLAGRRHPQEDCQRLVDLALAAGGPDNVTVIQADYTIRSIESGRHTS